MDRDDEEETPNQTINSDKIKQIRKILETHFNEEINYKKLELETIDDRIFQAKNTLDKLRVCIICKFYSLDGQLNIDDYKNHPAIRQLQCEHLDLAANNTNTLTSTIENNSPKDELKNSNIKESDDSVLNSNSNDLNERLQSNYKQFDINLSIGNVSKYLKSASTSNENIQQDETSLESSQYNQDLITHKWMMYLRSSNCPKLENYIKKVIFYLHSSYKPYDVVEVKSAPFQLIKRGWGEFPIHVQIHFKDPRNKRVDISHLLKLDWTQTGLQTFGGETNQDIQLLIKQNDFISTNCHTNHRIEMNENQIVNNQSILTSNNTIKEVENEPKIVINEPITEPIKQTTNANLNDLLNLRPKLSQAVNLNQPTVKALPISLNETKTSNENSAKVITSKININKPGLSIVTTKITATMPIKNQITTNLLTNQQIKPTFNKNQNLNNLSFKPVLNDSNDKNTINKSQVIYKVDSSDLKSNESTSNEPINPLHESDLKKLKPTTQLTKVVSNQTDHESLLKRKHNENEQAETSFEKKSKNGINEDLKQVTALDTNLNDSITENNLPINRANQLIYTAEKLSEKFNIEPNTQSIALKNCSNFEHLIKLSLKYFPIVLNYSFESSTTPNKRRFQLTFCAKTLQEFYSWPYAKRKANEWLRALHIKRFISDSCASINVKCWSTKDIVLYLRSHGHTPLENQHIKLMNKVKESSEYHYVNSLTPINRLIKKSKIYLNDDFNTNDNKQDDEVLIDILGDDKKVSNSYIKKQSNLMMQDFELNENNENVIEMCQGSKYIKEQLDILNIKTNRVNLVPSDETTTDSNVYACNLVEKFIFVLCKRFADDLIRQTCADMYFIKPTADKTLITNNKNLKKSTNDTADLVVNQKFPTNLNVLNIFNTIKTHDRFDFLTNKYMANSSKQCAKETTDNKLCQNNQTDVNLNPLNDQLYNSKNINLNNNKILTQTNFKIK